MATNYSAVSYCYSDLLLNHKYPLTAVGVLQACQHQDCKRGADISLIDQFVYQPLHYKDEYDGFSLEGIRVRP